MLQLSQNKKIVISALFALIMFSAFILLVKKDSNFKQSTDGTGDVNYRLMTELEKTSIVGIDPVQEAEIINDKDGLYIYRIK